LIQKIALQGEIMMKNIFVCLGLFVSMLVSVQASDCRPPPPDVAELIQIRPNFHTVRGPLAEFDPCHKSVEFSLPGNSLFSKKVEEKPPLVILVHGGGGLGKLEKNMARALNQRGYATLVFDAYQMNNFYQGLSLFLTGMTNGGRQRMIYKATFGAYQWAIVNTKIDTSKIFFHGVSNGGSVLLNIAGAVDPNHVKGVFSEGPSPAGIGMPHKINVPLRMVFGKLDNYGGKAEDDWMWERIEPCLILDHYKPAPSGTAETCNHLVNAKSNSITPYQWFEQQKAAGADIEVWFYENAAHGILAGPIDRGIRLYGGTMKRWAWTGASSEAAEKLILDMEKFINAVK
jgi:dienelactone hydrolase